MECCSVSRCTSAKVILGKFTRDAVYVNLGSSRFAIVMSHSPEVAVHKDH